MNSATCDICMKWQCALNQWESVGHVSIHRPRGEHRSSGAVLSWGRRSAWAFLHLISSSPSARERGHGSGAGLLTDSPDPVLHRLAWMPKTGGTILEVNPAARNPFRTLRGPLGQALIAAQNLCFLRWLLFCIWDCIKDPVDNCAWN